MKKIFLLLFLNSCSFSIFAVGTNNSIFKNDEPVKIKKFCKFELPFDIYYGSKYYNVNKVDDIKYYKVSIDDFNIYLETYNNSKIKILSFGILPILPSLPLIPSFFFPAIGNKDFCGGNNFKVVLTFSDNKKIIKTEEINIDLKNIYLLFKDGKKIYPINYYVDNSYKNQNPIEDKNKLNYIIEFPISCKNSDNSLIFIENVVKNGEKIHIPSGKIMYNSALMFVSAYFKND